MAGIADQFKGLPMSDLIGQPLIAAAKAQGQLSNITQQFIKDVGLDDTGSGSMSARSVDFKFNTPVTTTQVSAGNPDVTTTKLEPNDLSVPILSIVNVPNLSVKKVTIDFAMEVKAASKATSSSDTTGSISTQAKYAAWWSPVTCSMKASVTTNKKSENVRTTDNSAKYNVHVEARDDGAPEGLMKVLDILAAGIVPCGKSTTAPLTSQPGH
jgi:hypothetical protein